MPAVKSFEWFITLSTPDESSIDLEVVHKLVHSYPNFHVVKEFGKEGNHPHYHCVLWGLAVEQRQDVVRRKWIQALDLTAFAQHGITVCPVHARDRLIGKYLEKDPLREIIWSSLSEAEVANLQSKHAATVASDKDKKKGKSLTLLNAPGEIVKFAQNNDMPLDRKRDLAAVIKLMIKSGFNLMGVMGRLKHIWVYIEAMLDIHDYEYDLENLLM